MDIQKTLARMLNMIESTTEADSGCDAVYDVMEELVEMQLDGGNLQELVPAIHNHLESCMCCQSELNALRKILEAGDEL